MAAGTNATTTNGGASVTTASLKKKPSSKGSSKKPYNEGAEESKGWLADENSANMTPGGSDPAKNQINPNHYEVDDNIKVELGPDGKPNKLKDAFLLRPPNNQILLMSSLFNKRP
jgi:hypothetical protein